MPYISKDAPKYELSSKRKIFIFLAVLIIAFGLGFYFQTQREEKMKHTKQTTAIIDSINHTTRGGGNIHFYIEEKKIKVNVWAGDFGILKPGDTILIRYAVEDPKLVKIVRKYYMKKYKNYIE